jgi:hypothetical protein
MCITGAGILSYAQIVALITYNVIGSLKYMIIAIYVSASGAFLFLPLVSPDSGVIG